MPGGMGTLEWYEVVARLSLAAGLGAALGIEREFDGHAAGLRTHMLLTLGASLFGVLSVAAFDGFITARSESNVNVDPTRIAAYVLPAVGFIGGGAIVKTGRNVIGITTAASLWVAASVGVASGLGFWVGAVTATVLALVALEGLQPVSKWAAEIGRRHGRQPS